MNAQTGGVTLEFQTGQLKNFDFPGLPLHFLPLSGQIAKLLTVDLQGRVHGRNLEDLSPEPGKDILSRGALLRLLVGIFRIRQRSDLAPVSPLRPKDKRVAEILRYIDAHVHEEITIEALAEQLFLSKYHMMRLFREQTGVTIHAYIVDRRLMIARDLMSRGAGATEACYKAGFNSYCTFCRAYNKRFGMSPTGKRDRALRGEETYE